MHYLTQSNNVLDKNKQARLFCRRMPPISTTTLFRRLIQLVPYNIESHAYTKADSNIILPQLVLKLELAGQTESKKPPTEFLQKKTRPNV